MKLSTTLSNGAATLVMGHGRFGVSLALAITDYGLWMEEAKDGRIIAQPIAVRYAMHPDGHRVFSFNIWAVQVSFYLLRRS